MNWKSIPVKGIWNGRRGALRAVIAAAATLILILAGVTAAKQLVKERLLPMEQLGEPVEGESAVTLYYDFLNNLNSGKIVKKSYSDKSLYDMVSRSTETITFTTGQNKKRVMTYQQRQPIVFWHYPEPNYYDGTYYYYKHNGDWFIDTFNRYQKQIQPDALGIPSSAISQYRITGSMVYCRPDGGYQAYVYAVNRNDRTRQAEIIGALDENFQFSYIKISVTYPEDERSGSDIGRTAVSTANGLMISDETENKITETYTIEYQRVNESLEVTPPKSLSPEEMKFLQEEYQAAKQSRKNAGN